MRLAEILWVVKASPSLEDISILVKINDFSFPDEDVSLRIYCWSCFLGEGGKFLGTPKPSGFNHLKSDERIRLVILSSDLKEELNVLDFV